MERRKPRERDWISRTPKWLLLGVFWLVQGVVLYLAQAFLYVSQSDVEGFETVTLPDGSIAGSRQHSMLGSWPSIEDYTRLLTASEFVVWMLGAIAAITAAQAVFVWPVRRPGAMGPRGRSARASLCVGGLVVGALVVAFAMALYGVAEEYDHAAADAVDSLGVPLWAVVAVIAGFGWAVATPLLVAFVRPGDRESVLARLSRRLLLGTMVEIALLIPLDVMVRRKTSCYCWAGTYWGLTLCGAVGVFALGPAVFLPLLAKRRRAWYAGHCGVCGYDMAGRMDAARCPECGTGWRD